MFLLYTVQSSLFTIYPSSVAIYWTSAFAVKTTLPFNLIKTALNASLTLLIYKPIVTIFRSTSLLEKNEKKSSFSIAFIVISLFVLISLIFIILVINGVI